MSNRVVHFEIHVTQPERAIRFYGDVFGWEFPKWLEEPPYWGVMTAPEGSDEPGINGGLLVRNTEPPATASSITAFVCTIQVDSFDETHQKIMKAGGTVAMPKHPITGIAWQGYYHDTEGNLFGVHEPDPDAK